MEKGGRNQEQENGILFYDMNGEEKRAERKGVDPRVRGDDEVRVRG